MQERGMGAWRRVERMQKESKELMNGERKITKKKERKGWTGVMKETEKSKGKKADEEELVDKE
jgi:hypothetical protein